MTGLHLSQYRIDAELGRGGMGVVYRAFDTSLDRVVALKVLPASALASEDDRSRFLREAKAAAQLSHPNVCQVYQVGEAELREVAGEHPTGAEKRPFIAMEYIDGETLSALIAKRPLPLPEAIRIARDVADALSEAHAAGIVHRDIKSSNVMLTSKNRVKVLDFGLAKTAASTMLTRQGATVGTAATMSPEQSRGEAVDHRTDIWALGVVLYESVSGILPFAGDYEQAVVYSILNTEPEPLTAVRSGVPMELERIVNKCLAKEAARRYASMADLVVDLEALASSLAMSMTSGERPVAGHSTAGYSSAGNSTAGRAGDATSRTGIRSIAPGGRLPGANGGARSRNTVLLIVGAIAVVFAATFGWFAGRSSTRPLIVNAGATSYTFSHDVPAPDGIAWYPSPSPDGQVIAYVSEGKLYFHHANGETTRGPELEDEVSAVVATPDSRSFVVATGLNGFGTRLYVLPVDGDPRLTPMPVAEGLNLAGMSFGSDGKLYFGSPAGLYRFDLRDAAPELVVPSEDVGGRYILYPLPVPGREKMFVVLAPGPAIRFASLEGIQSGLFDMASGRVTEILQDRAALAYLPSGLLLYIEGFYEWNLRRYDLESTTFSGDLAILDFPFSPLSWGYNAAGVMTSVPGMLTREFSVRTIGPVPNAVNEWFTEVGGFTSIRFSPDRTRYAYLDSWTAPAFVVGQRGEAPNLRIGIPASVGSPISFVWPAADNQLIMTTGSRADGSSGLYTVELDGTNRFTKLASWQGDPLLLDVSPDGGYLLLAEPTSGPSGVRIVERAVQDSAQVEIAFVPGSTLNVLIGSFRRRATYSPDGRFLTVGIRDSTSGVLAFSNRSRATGASHLLTTGADHVSWIDANSVLLERFGDPAASPPTPTRYYRLSVSDDGRPNDQPEPVGQAFDAVPTEAVYDPATGALFVPTFSTETTVPLTIHTNWFAELERLLPGERR